MSSLSRPLCAAALSALLCACALPGSHLRALQPAGAAAQPEQFVVVAVANTPMAGAGRAGSTPHGYDPTPLYGSSGPARRSLHGIERDYGMRAVAQWPIGSLGVQCALLRVAGSTASLLEKLSRDPRVALAEPLNTFHTLESADPLPYNDPYANLQHALRELQVVHVPSSVRGQGVRIAVIDTGVDLEHPDLKGRIVDHENYVDDDDQRFRLDHHGTAVAGVIAAVENNGIGIVGIAPDAQLLVRKACWEPAAGAAAVCNSFTLAQALDSALRSRVDIVNLSLAGPPDPLLQRLIEQGMRAGLVFVAAVPPEGGRGFPAELAGVVPVAAIDTAGPAAHASFVAPSSDILTLTPGGHYDFVSGSSLAAAEVTGVVALMLSARPHLAAERVRSALEEGVRASNAGLRMIDACRALRAATSRELCTGVEERLPTPSGQSH